MLKEIIAYETSDGKKYLDKYTAERYETNLQNTPTKESHPYQPSVGENCLCWSEGCWRDCYIVGKDCGDVDFVVQSYEDLFFADEDTIFKEGEGEN